ncbi:hypothetical protein DSO57_1031194 [Entomophthora muscae]|uniref:Uncharacterized protein n=1 Tax=Entomophthora muscae TaxID=34485 RepID=A0ACC2SPN9_9FUNG|nr:hypothetical protein DSO57_1031194 [Entomophthora muscae]
MLAFSASALMSYHSMAVPGLKPAYKKAPAALVSGSRLFHVRIISALIHSLSHSATFSGSNLPFRNAVRGGILWFIHSSAKDKLKPMAIHNAASAKEVVWRHTSHSTRGSVKLCYHSYCLP